MSNDRVVHVLGNGDSAIQYRPAKGLKIACNLPPFEIPNIFLSCMVDFKMMGALTEGSVQNPYNWVLGYRPKIWMEKKPDFYMRVSGQVKEFYTHLPKYCKNYTDFNCGHFATHYSCNKLKADEIHMYGFDSIFNFDTRSKTDFYLNSDRGPVNTQRLVGNWREVWEGIFNEFSDKQFVLYGPHDQPQTKLPENVEIRVGK